jgi:hypothetical protein
MMGLTLLLLCIHFSAIHNSLLVFEEEDQAIKRLPAIELNNAATIINLIIIL